MSGLVKRLRPSFVTVYEFTVMVWLVVCGPSDVVLELSGLSAALETGGCSLCTWILLFNKIQMRLLMKITINMVSDKHQHHENNLGKVTSPFCSHVVLRVGCF